METKEILQYNEQYYDETWQNSNIASHEMWPIWKTIETCLSPGGALLELGPGLRPRIPIKNSYFIEISTQAGELLKKNGGYVELPQDNTFLSTPQFFDVVCAFEVLEHIPEDEKVITQISAAMKRGGKLFISVPLHMNQWTEWDTLVGHHRRYDPLQLQKMLEANGFEIERFAEDNMFSKVYMNKTIQKIAKFSIQRFPKLSMKIEAIGLGLLCTFARKFHALKWKNGAIKHTHDDALGMYIVCRKL